MIKHSTTFRTLTSDKDTYNLKYKTTSYISPD